MGALDRDNGRTIETERQLPDVRVATQARSSGELPATATINERELSPIRLPIESRSVSSLSDYSTAITYDRTLADIRQPISPRSVEGRFVDSTEPVSQVSVAESQPLGQTIANYYSGGGSGGGRSYDTPISVVPGGELNQSNSNMSLILLVLVVAGAGAYWYYKKGGFNA